MSELGQQRRFDDVPLRKLPFIKPMAPTLAKIPPAAWRDGRAADGSGYVAYIGSPLA